MVLPLAFESRKHSWAGGKAVQICLLGNQCRLASTPKIAYTGNPECQSHEVHLLTKLSVKFDVHHRAQINILSLWLQNQDAPPWTPLILKEAKMLRSSGLSSCVLSLPFPLLASSLLSLPLFTPDPRFSLIRWACPLDPENGAEEAGREKVWKELQHSWLPLYCPPMKGSGSTAMGTH